MACWNHYYLPTRCEEAVGLLTRYAGQARVIGGGTDLILEIQQGHRPRVEAMIDLSRVAGFNEIREEHGCIVIGAAVNHHQIVAHPAIRISGTCLVESCGVIGGPQVRNVGTLAGNLAHALPAGDGTLGLIALGGEVEISSASGSEWVDALSTFKGPGKSTIDPTRELISRLRFKPCATGEGSAFRRVMRPQGVALPVIGMAARLHIRRNVIAACRICIGPAGPTPFQALETTAFLLGKTPGPETFLAAAEVAAAECAFRDSRHRATSDYRRAMLLTQLPITLQRAADRADGRSIEPEGVGQ